MRIFPFVLALFAASPGFAGDYCNIGSDRTQALPKTLIGAWHAVFRGGIFVTPDGKPHSLPDDAEAQDVDFTADVDGLNLEADAFFPAMHLKAD